MMFFPTRHGEHPRRARRLVALVAGTTALALTVAACGGSSSGNPTSASGAVGSSAAAGSSAAGGSSSAGASSAGGGSTGAATSSGTLTIALSAQILTFDPWTSPSGLNGTVLNSVATYDSLTHISPDGKVLPWLATSWTTPNPSTLKLTLRSDVKFSDGTALDAAAVKANIDYAIADKQPGECNTFLTGVTTTVDSATQVTLKLATPNPSLLVDLGTCAGNIVNPKALADPTSLKSTPAGSGPYTLSTTGTIQGQQWTFQRNPNYWSPSTYPYSTIVLKFFADATAAANAAKTGTVDIIQNVDPKTDTSGLTYAQSNPQEFRGLFITDVKGTISKPLGDERVRQAMNYAIDRNTIASALFAGGQAEVVNSTPFAKGSIGYSSALDTAYSYDPAKAKSLLAAAGYPNGFTVNVLDDAALGGNLAQAIAGDERKVGINMNISDHSSDFVTQMQTGTWPIVFGNYTQGLDVYHTMQGMLDPTGFFNPLKNQEPSFDAALKTVAGTTDAALQTSTYQKLAVDIATQAWFIAPVEVKSNVAYNSKTNKVELTDGSSIPYLYNITKP